MHKTDLNSLHHGVFNLNYYLIFVTKYHRQAISNQMLERLKEIFIATVSRWECELVEFNGESDHVHLLLSLNPKVCLSSFVNNLKTVSSRLIRRDDAEELSRFYWKPLFWSRSYCALTYGGAPLSIIKQ